MVDVVWRMDMMVELNNFPLQRYQRSFMGWSHASSHLPRAGIIPARGPPFCLMDASEHIRTHTHTEYHAHTRTQRGEDTCTHSVHAVAFKLLLCLKDMV